MFEKKKVQRLTITPFDVDVDAHLDAAEGLCLGHRHLHRESTSKPWLKTDTRNLRRFRHTKFKHDHKLHVSQVFAQKNNVGMMKCFILPDFYHAAFTARPRLTSEARSPVGAHCWVN